VPWKYGFKSGKSIVKIRFVDKQPKTSWEEANASEYGFYSNVNPKVDHPRWSQATERRIGEDGLLRQEAPDADVQRLRAAGRPAVRRHGPEEALLTQPVNRLLQAKAAKPLLFVLCLLPFAQLLWEPSPTRWAPTRPRR
jgi:hypothetical protein